MALLSICPPQPAPNLSLLTLQQHAPLGTHRCRPAPGSSGPGHFSQHDEASGGDAADGVDRFLCYFLTVQIEFDLEVAHGHMHLGGRWREVGWSCVRRRASLLKTVMPSAQFPDCCCYYRCVFNEQTRGLRNKFQCLQCNTALFPDVYLTSPWEKPFWSCSIK